MKKQKITDALSGLDAAYIEEALSYRPIAKKSVWIRYASAAACLALAAAIGIGALLYRGGDGGISPYPVRRVELDALSGDNEIGVIPRWEAMHVTSKFGEFEHTLGKFSSGAKAIDATLLGESHGRVQLQGYDVYTETEYTAEGEVFAINGISTSFALALRFDGEEKCYIYRNVWYRPDTLGDLIDTMALEEHLKVKTVYYDYVSARGEHAFVEFEGLTLASVWELLLSDRTLENVYDQKEMYPAKMSISVSADLLGYHNVGIWVTEDGYLVTNLGSTGKAFYIGTERVNAFIEHVMSTCQGYEIVYDYPDGYEVPESGVDLNGFEITVQTTSHDTTGQN